jgi:hypothetical protein
MFFSLRPHLQKGKEGSACEPLLNARLGLDPVQRKSSFSTPDRGLMQAFQRASDHQSFLLNTPSIQAA